MTRARLIRILNAAACTLVAALPAISAIDAYREGAARRTEDPLAAIYTPELVKARLTPLAPLLVAWLILLAVGLALGVKGSPTAGPAAQKPGPEKRLRRAGAIQAALVAAALALIVAGALNGGARDVLIKAINICTECVGLG